VPKREYLDTADFSVDLVVEVVASSAQEEAANALLPRVASSRSDPRLGRDEFEGSLEVVDEGERSGRTIGSPPRRGSPDLCRGAGRRLDRKARGQGLLTKFPKQGFRVDELPTCRLLEGLFEGYLLVGS
jgi:hypothetical protein